MGWLSKLLFPPKCASCGVLLDWYETDSATALCPSCQKLWESEKTEDCGICGKRVTACSCVTAEMQKAKCAAFYKLTYYYSGRRNCVQNRVIYHIKNVRDNRTAAFLARELSPLLELQLAQAEDLTQAVITFVPRGNSAKLEHGTDQAEALAKALSRCLGISCVKAIVRGTAKGNAQKALSASERRKNAKHAFALNRNASVNGKTVFLVDDIVTTGSSMASCARLLRRAGAKSVCCFAIASDDMNRERM